MDGLFDEEGEPEDLLCVRLHFSGDVSRTFAFGEDSANYKGLWLSKFSKFLNPEPVSATDGEGKIEGYQHNREDSNDEGDINDAESSVQVAV